MKKISMILLTALTAAVLTACGGNTDVESNGGGAGSSASEESKGYVFEYEGVSISVDALAEPIIKELGEPVSYYEAASCAFEGMDKMYTYNSVEIDTYPDEKGKDRISGIIFKDDMVETPEGVSLFETKDDMIKAYGEDFTDENGTLVYEKDGMKLCFILDGDEIVSIEYMTTVLD
ncbi:MAG: hypothetical protein E7293_03100 [Lachnospiraceae bacterium]|nr:hypothetical protein [Lachnospiraceae bacterium]